MNIFKKIKNWYEELQNSSIGTCSCCGKKILYKDAKGAISLIMADEKNPVCLSCFAKIFSPKWRAEYIARQMMEEQCKNCLKKQSVK